MSDSGRRRTRRDEPGNDTGSGIGAAVPIRAGDELASLQARRDEIDSSDHQRVVANANEELGRFRMARDEFPKWEEILGAVAEAVLNHARKESLDVEEISSETFYQVVGRTISNLPHLNVQPNELPSLVSLLRRKFFGLGELEPIMAIEGLEEITCNRYDEIFYTVHGQRRLLDPSPFASEREVQDFLNMVFAKQGREINLSNQFEDGTLPDGSRIAAAVPPFSYRGASFSIRKFNPRPFTMEDYLRTDMFSVEFLDFLQDAIRQNMNILVSGGTSSGKTTFLNAIAALIPRQDRVVIIENTKELQFETDNFVYIQASQKGADATSRDGGGQYGRKALTIRDGLYLALRYTPDRIIIGEVRSHEAFDLMQALNTGHDGSFTTLHANTAIDALARLESLATGAGETDQESVRNDIARNVDIVIQVGRFPGTPYRKVLEAIQVVHPFQLNDASRARVAQVKAEGDFKNVRGPIYTFPLFVRDEAGRLVHKHEMVPVIGKRQANADPVDAAERPRVDAAPVRPAAPSAPGAPGVGPSPHTAPSVAAPSAPDAPALPPMREFSS